MKLLNWVQSKSERLADKNLKLNSLKGLGSSGHLYSNLLFFNVSKFVDRSMILHK